jgi:hypothetical protein
MIFSESEYEKVKIFIKDRTAGKFNRNLKMNLAFYKNLWNQWPSKRNPSLIYGTVVEKINYVRLFVKHQHTKYHTSSQFKILICYGIVSGQTVFKIPRIKSANTISKNPLLLRLVPANPNSHKHTNLTQSGNNLSWVATCQFVNFIMGLQINLGFFVDFSQFFNCFLRVFRWIWGFFESFSLIIFEGLMKVL